MKLDALLEKVRPAAEAGDLSPLFVVDADVPKNAKDYAKYFFNLGQLPTAQGDDCAAIVEVSVPNMGDPFDAHWKFKRVNNDWKIAAAPLPSGHTPVKPIPNP